MYVDKYFIGRLLVFAEKEAVCLVYKKNSTKKIKSFVLYSLRISGNRFWVFIFAVLISYVRACSHIDPGRIDVYKTDKHFVPQLIAFHLFYFIIFV